RLGDADREVRTCWRWRSIGACAHPPVNAAESARPHAPLPFQGSCGIIERSGLDVAVSVALCLRPSVVRHRGPLFVAEYPPILKNKTGCALCQVLGRNRVKSCAKAIYHPL